MKKIVYIADCSLKQFNSVRDILYNIMNHEDMHKYQHVMIKSWGNMCLPLKVEEVAGYRTYSSGEMGVAQIFQSEYYNGIEKLKYSFLRTVNKTISLFPRVRNVYSHSQLMKSFKKVFSIEKPDLVICFTISPIKGISKICNNRDIPYISILYDTFIERPYLEKKILPIEKAVIEHSQKYFVPSFFYSGYLKHYNYSNLCSYNLPLLIPREDVLRAYKNAKDEFDFAYFGQIQSFRRGDCVKNIFKSLGSKLSIFGAGIRNSDDVFEYHDSVSQDKLYETVASSKFLVAFDNGEPYEHYLPSKVYLYVSFTKPIVAFGSNKKSALKTFFEGYPWFYYHDIDETSLEGLKEFLNSSFQGKFDESVYSRYLEHLPHEALKPITMSVALALKDEEVHDEATVSDLN